MNRMFLLPILISISFLSPAFADEFRANAILNQFLKSTEVNSCSVATPLTAASVYSECFDEAAWSSELKSGDVIDGTPPGEKDGDRELVKVVSVKDDPYAMSSILSSNFESLSQKAKTYYAERANQKFSDASVQKTNEARNEIFKNKERGDEPADLALGFDHFETVAAVATATCDELVREDQFKLKFIRVPASASEVVFGAEKIKNRAIENAILTKARLGCFRALRNKWAEHLKQAKDLSFRSKEYLEKLSHPFADEEAWAKTLNDKSVTLLRPHTDVDCIQKIHAFENHGGGKK